MKNKFKTRNPRLTSGQANHETNPNFLNPKSKICNLKSFLHYSKFIILILLFVCLLFVGSCRERVLPPDNGNGVHVPKLKIEAEDIGATDCFIRLKFLDTSNVQAKTFVLVRDGKPLMTNTIITNDTLLLDEGLLPKRTYRYKAYRLVNNVLVDSSAELPVITMDTTSHNFIWKIDTLGDGNSSVLRDVCIINDTMVLAVGEINVKDSLGNWINPPYNFAKWNGKKWQLETTTDIGYGYGENYSVLAFGSNDIWAGGSVPKHWDGQKWTFHGSTRGYQGGFRILKIWGTSSQNLYVVGEGGNIRFFNGVSWRRLESGTTTSINDIFGITDIQKNENKILCTVTNKYFEGDIKLISIKTDLKVDSIGWYSSNHGLHSVWFNNLSRIFVCGDGVHVFKKNFWKGMPGMPNFYKNRIRGIEINDIFIVGDYGLVSHFNGFSWKTYSNLELPYGSYNSLSYKNNKVFIVGFNQDKAIVLRGYCLTNK